MKTLVIIIGAAMLAVGCSHKPDARDAKIAKLESRVSELEVRCDGLKDSFTNLLSVCQKMNAEDSESMVKIAALVQKDQDDMEAKWEALIPMLAALTNPLPRQATAPRPYYPAQPQPSAYATKDGVPIAVYNQIAAEAARRYPTDYDMQVFVIKEQVEAYLKLH